MPSGDRTGPMGQGPMTGRAFGFCGGYENPGYDKRYGGHGRGFGFGRRMGRHRGFGRRGYQDYAIPGYYPPPRWMPDKEDEIKMLKTQAEALQRIQKDIEKRLGELETKSNLDD